MPVAFGTTPYNTGAYAPGTKTQYLERRIDCSRVRVSTDDGATWYDLTTRTLEITVEKQKDGGTSTVDVTFANAPADGDNLSLLVTPLLHPAFFLGAAQVASGGQQLPASLLDIGNVIAIDGAYTTDGSEPTDADFYPVFYGVLGAQTKVGHDDNGNRTVSIHALDYASGRLNAFYLNDTTGIGPGSPEAVIQNILDKALGAGVMTLYVPVASQGDVTQNGIDNLVQNTTAWQAIQSIAEQIGFDCRWLWQPSLGAWRLTLQQPSRDMSTPDYVVDITGMYLHELDTTDSYLRNQCTVEYRDSGTGQRATVTVQDTTGPYNVNSKAGVRAVYITEADTSIIDTAAEATTLAQTVVNDLSSLYAQVEVELPFSPHVEIYQKIQLTDAYISDTPQTYAMDSVEHRMAYNEWTTTVKLSGAVSLRKDAWLQKHGAPGAKRPFRLGDYRSESVGEETLQDRAASGAKVALDGTASQITGTHLLTQFVEDASWMNSTLLDGPTIYDSGGANWCGLIWMDTSYAIRRARLAEDLSSLTAGEVVINASGTSKANPFCVFQAGTTNKLLIGMGDRGTGEIWFARATDASPPVVEIAPKVVWTSGGRPMMRGDGTTLRWLFIDGTSVKYGETDYSGASILSPITITTDASGFGFTGACMAIDGNGDRHFVYDLGNAGEIYYQKRDTANNVLVAEKILYSGETSNGLEYPWIEYDGTRGYLHVFANDGDSQLRIGRIDTAGNLIFAQMVRKLSKLQQPSAALGNLDSGHVVVAMQKTDGTLALAKAYWTVDVDNYASAQTLFAQLVD